MSGTLSLSGALLAAGGGGGPGTHKRAGGGGGGGGVGRIRVNAERCTYEKLRGVLALSPYPTLGGTAEQCGYLTLAP